LMLFVIVSTRADFGRQLQAAASSGQWQAAAVAAAMAGSSDRERGQDA
jgi:hypothetical protein